MKRFIMHKLLIEGQITRNKSLSSYIYAIKRQNPAWQIDAKMVKTPSGKDYVYKLINRDEILANIDKKLRSLK